MSTNGIFRLHFINTAAGLFLSSSLAASRWIYGMIDWTRAGCCFTLLAMFNQARHRVVFLEQYLQGYQQLQLRHSTTRALA